MQSLSAPASPAGSKFACPGTISRVRKDARLRAVGTRSNERRCARFAPAFAGASFAHPTNWQPISMQRGPNRNGASAMAPPDLAESDCIGPLVDGDHALDLIALESDRRR